VVSRDITEPWAEQTLKNYQELKIARQTNINAKLVRELRA
jgi:hypothetical protein